MELTSEKLNQFIEEELDSTYNIDEVIEELDSISSEFEKTLEKLENVIEQTKSEDEDISDRLKIFYFKILDNSSDLNFFIEELKQRYDYRD